jgi:hypothetical protein
VCEMSILGLIDVVLIVVVSWCCVTRLFEDIEEGLIACIVLVPAALFVHGFLKALGLP